MSTSLRDSAAVVLLALLCAPPSAALAGDRAGEVRISHGTAGMRGQLLWGEVGMRLDFSYPISPGRTAQATLAIRGDTGRASLMLHGTSEVVEGVWPLGAQVSPLDLLEPDADARPLQRFGNVRLGALACELYGDRGETGLRVWYPSEFADVPVMARWIAEDGASSELSLRDVHPGTLTVADLLVPESYETLPFDLADMMVRATDSQAAAVLGARALVWMGAADLEASVQTVGVQILVDAD